MLSVIIPAAFLVVCLSVYLFLSIANKFKHKLIVNNITVMFNYLLHWIRGLHGVFIISTLGGAVKTIP